MSMSPVSRCRTPRRCTTASAPMTIIGRSGQSERRLSSAVRRLAVMARAMAMVSSLSAGSANGGARAPELGPVGGHLGEAGDDEHQLRRAGLEGAAPADALDLHPGRTGGGEVDLDPVARLDVPLEVRLEE